MMTVSYLVSGEKRKFLKYHAQQPLRLNDLDRVVKGGMAIFKKKKRKNSVNKKVPGRILEQKEARRGPGGSTSSTEYEA